MSTTVRASASSAINVLFSAIKWIATALTIHFVKNSARQFIKSTMLSRTERPSTSHIRVKLFTSQALCIFTPICFIRRIIGTVSSAVMRVCLTQTGYNATEKHVNAVCTTRTSLYSYGLWFRRPLWG